MFTKDELIGGAGSYRTQSLFLEVSLGNTDCVIMTLREHSKDYKGKHLVSLREEYLKDADPTGYTTAIRLFNSWNHWLRLKENKMINAYIVKFEAELDVMIRSGAVQALIETAMQEGAKGATAAKYIAEKGWDKRRAGAPSKEEKQRELKVTEAISDEVQEAYERLELH